jgi:transposase-like protein
MCGSVENQIKQWRTTVGSQRCLCKNCGKKYTIDPKFNAYPEEERQAAIKMYYSCVSGRGMGRIWGMNKSNVTRWIKKTENLPNDVIPSETHELDELYR